MAVKIMGRQFNPKVVKRFAQRQFEDLGLVFSKEDPKLSTKLRREDGAALAHATFFLKSGLKLKLGVKFDIEDGKILPKSKGIIYNAKLGSSAIPLARPKGDDYDWTAFIKKIAEYVKKKEAKIKPKTPTVSRAEATKGKIPNTFKAKLEAKRAERDEKRAELDRQQKLQDEQTSENTRLETEIEEFKKTA